MRMSMESAVRERVGCGAGGDGMGMWLGMWVGIGMGMWVGIWRGCGWGWGWIKHELDGCHEIRRLGTNVVEWME